MAADKITKLAKYVEDLKNKIASPPPDKRKFSSLTYYEFLKRELDFHSKKLENLRIYEPSKK